MKHFSRSTALKVAAILSALMGVFGVVGSLPLIARGAVAVGQSNDSPPYFILMLGLVTAVIGIVGAYGAWKQQRWGIVLTILANLVNGLSAAPGILFAPIPFLTVVATGTVVVSTAIIVFCLWRDRQPVAA